MRGVRRNTDRDAARSMRMNGAALTSICLKLKAGKASVYEWICDLPRPHACTPKGRWDGKRKPRKAPMQKKAIMRNGDYLLIVAPDWYRGKLYRGRYCYQHHAIWNEVNGPIQSGYVVHHKNHDKHDNRIENLELLTLADHSRLHHEIRGSLISKATTC